MKAIKLYLDLEKIEEETGRKFDVEGEYSDNFLRWITNLAYQLVFHDGDRHKNTSRAIELYDILKNCYSEWDMKH